MAGAWTVLRIRRTCLVELDRADDHSKGSAFVVVLFWIEAGFSYALCGKIL